ncbi:MAG: branched-chain amino acid transporter [Desulfitibacter sp. BRH_c19]|nr:MAG: branched-chain amino acid transporter [Desulfitibacter sp. BRH_c19]
MEKYFLLIMAMTLVTYLPRVFPLLFLHELKLSPKIQEFLSNIPYAVLGALIVPGVFYSTGNLSYSMVGAATAVLMAYFNLNLLLVVLGSILSIFLFQIWL